MRVGWWESALGQLFIAAALWAIWSAVRGIRDNLRKIRAAHEARRRLSPWKEPDYNEWAIQGDGDAQRSLGGEGRPNLAKILQEARRQAAEGDKEAQRFLDRQIALLSVRDHINERYPSR